MSRELENEMSPKKKRKTLRFKQSELEKVQLTPEEELDLRENYVTYQHRCRPKRKAFFPIFDNFSSNYEESSCSEKLSESSDQAQSSRSESSETVAPAVGTPTPELFSSSREDCDDDDDDCEIETRLRSRDGIQQLNLMSFADFVKQHPTSDWNTRSDRLYNYFNTSLYIVDPDHLLSISMFKDNDAHTMSNILEQLDIYEEESWGIIKCRLKRILKIYKNFDELANSMGDMKLVRTKAIEFLNRTRHKSGEYSKIDSSMKDYLDPFIGFAEDFITSPIDENLFENYVSTLIQVFSNVTQGCLIVQQKDLYFPMPRGITKKKKKAVKMLVRPDIVVSVRRVILVGEVKRLRAHGKYHRTCRGKKRKGPVTASDGKLDTPCPGPSNAIVGGGDQQEEEDNQMPPRTGSSCYYRFLDKREFYQVKSALPQLMGQLVSAMYQNSQPFIVGSHIENVQLGFIVEGFKLRFVKMSVFKTSGDMKRPFGVELETLLYSQDLSCDVFLTQEFNLFKRSHLRMFFQILYAIKYVCERKSVF